MQDFDAEIEQKIKTFVDELHALVRQAAVEGVQDALGVKGTDAASPRPVRSAKKTKATAPERRSEPKQRIRRSPEQLARIIAKVRQHVQANAGQTVEQISKALGVPTKVLALPLIKLLKSQEVRKTGTKRSTKYFPAGAASAETTKAAKRRKAKK